MPYDIAAGTKLFGNGFMQGYTGQKQQNFENALSSQKVGLDQQQVDLQQQQFQAQQNALAKKQEGDQLTEHHKQLYAATGYVLASRTPKQTALSIIDPQTAQSLQQYGIDLNTMDDAAVVQLAQMLHEKSGIEIGMTPAQPFEQSDKYRELQMKQSGDMALEGARAKNARDLEAMRQRTEKAPTPQVISRPVDGGMMQDFSYDPRTPDARTPVGQPYSAVKNVSPKDINTAKTKLIQLDVAKKQLENIKAQWKGLQGSMSAGGFGQGYNPTVSGQKFDKAVDAMRATFSALTRVPGVGSMSDWEGKLAQAPLPSRKDYEAVTEQAIQQIDDLITATERGYSNFLGNDDSNSSGSGIAVGQTATIGGVRITRTK